MATRRASSVACQEGDWGQSTTSPWDPVPPAPQGTGGWQGWLVRTHPVVKPAGLHAPTHPATNSSPLTISPVQFSSHPSTHPAKPTFHHSTWTSTSTHHPLTASFYETIHPLSTYLHTHPSIHPHVPAAPLVLLTGLCSQVSSPVSPLILVTDFSYASSLQKSQKDNSKRNCLALYFL